MAADRTPRLPVLPNDEAWRKLPDAPEKAEPLPVWARAFAAWQPITTARMLELDALHRSGDRLDARFRAVVRWAAADANRCDYTKAMATADYARAAGATADLPVIMKRPDRLPEVDRLGAAFARKMMLEAHAVTDGEVTRLIDLLGDERMVALVALVAHASFQDRVILALNVSAGPGGVPPPVATRFGRPKPSTPAKPADHPATVTEAVPASVAWVRARQRLDEQKLRPGRIPVPPGEWVTKRMGQGHPSLWQNGILWSRICYGHQPELTDAWFDTSSAFRQEAQPDPPFINAVFWTVTDSLNCFY